MAKDVWEIKHVPERTKRSIKAYAAARGLTIAEALTQRFDPPLLSKKRAKEKKEEREEKEKA